MEFSLRRSAAGLALAPQVGEVIASLVPGAASRTANKVAATAHELWSPWKLVRRRSVLSRQVMMQITASTFSLEVKTR